VVLDFWSFQAKLRKTSFLMRAPFYRWLVMSLLIGVTGEVMSQGGIGLEAPPRVYQVVDRMPVWPGCVAESSQADSGWEAERACTQAAMLQYFASTLKLEGLDRYEPIPEKLLLAFTVTNQGEVTDIQILRGGHAPVEAQILQVMGGFPIFQPAMHEEEVVFFQYQLPLHLNVKR
jgi:hypothetical protein